MWCFCKAHLLIKVGQPVHAFELVSLQLAVEDGGLGDVVSGLDGGVGQAVALPKSRTGGGMLGRTATVPRLLVKQTSLRGTNGMQNWS